MDRNTLFSHRKMHCLFLLAAVVGFTTKPEKTIGDEARSLLGAKPFFSWHSLIVSARVDGQTVSPATKDREHIVCIAGSMHRIYELCHCP